MGEEFLYHQSKHQNLTECLWSTLF